MDHSQEAPLHDTERIQTGMAVDPKSLLEGQHDLPVGTDLTKYSLPSNFIMPNSLLEVYAKNWMLHTDLLAQANEPNDPLMRFFRVLQYTLSLFEQYEGGKKPFNPILGEIFECYTEEQGSSTRFVAEQVSHHPPITNFFFSNEQKGFSCMCSSTSQSHFMGTHVKISFDQFANIFLKKRNELYIIPQFPAIIFKTLRSSMEFTGNLSMTCEQTGFGANIKFHSKPLIGGKVKEISGIITQGSTTARIFKIKGTWDGMTEIVDQIGKVVFSWDRKTLPMTHPRPENLSETSSQRVWGKAVEAIRRGDWDTGTKEKRMVEEAQRKRLQDMKAKRLLYVPQYYTFDGELWRFKGYQQAPTSN
jgi:hypothetical protein